MTVTLRLADDAFQKTWDDTVLSSPHGMIFHTWQWLKLVELNTSTILLPMLVYKGTQLIALYPVFLQKKGFFTLAFSPPPGAYMLYLGPVIIDYESLKQDKKESVFIQIQEEIDKYLFGKNKCILSRIRTPPGLLDSRPLRWSGYRIEPLYTYRIPLAAGTKIVWENLDRKLRVDINKAVREGVTVRAGDWEDLEFIHTALFNRYLAQGFKPNDYTKYLRSLYNCFYPDNLKIFVAEYKGERAGGIITLCYHNVMFHWVGVPKSSLVGISANDLVQWEAIKWAADHDFKQYEIMDSGDVPQFRQFKAKWNPELIIWYSATRYSSFIYSFGAELLRIIQNKT
jgi:lipid II:glycine glycyltransferase (peptidoglycan interpeptide bridge formation enzyme)